MSIMDERGSQQQIQDFLSKFQQMTGGNTMGPPQQPQGGGIVSPGQVGQLPQAATPPFRGQGPNLPQIPQLPNLTAGGVQGPKGMPIGAQPMQTEFQTRAGRNAAVVTSAINSLAQFAGQRKQEQWQKKSAQAEQAWGSYMALNQAISDAQDPKQKQALQQQLQQMTQDKNFAKIFDKAHQDPTSAEGVGLQRAMKASKEDAMQKMQLAQLQAQIQEHQAKAAQAQAMTPRTDQERAVAMGTAPSADVQAREKARQEEKAQELQFKREQLAQQYDLRQQQIDDKKATDRERMQIMHEQIGLRKQMLDNQIEIASMKAAEKSKLPAQLIPRVEQAKQIKLMIDDLKTKLTDPEVSQFIGPVKGMAAGATRRFSSKFSDFMSEYNSLIAMQAIMHGYRGGASMDKTFHQAAAGPAQTVESFKGALEGLGSLPSNFIEDIKKQYPKDTIWTEDESGTSSKSTPAPTTSKPQDDPLGLVK